MTAPVIQVEGVWFAYDGATARRRLREVRVELDAALASSGADSKIPARYNSVWLIRSQAQAKSTWFAVSAI